mgnify:CR=1 FL=1
MRIAVLAPAWFAVPPTGYGGIEWVVSLLADGLVDAGHDVTLFASGDSRTKAKLAAIYPEAPSRQIGRTFAELKHALFCFAISSLISLRAFCIASAGSVSPEIAFSSQG